MWYARNPKREVFDVGPFPDRESAIDEAPAEMGLKPGEQFEVGRMVPSVPKVTRASIIGAIRESVEPLPDIAKAEKWEAQLMTAGAYHGDNLVDAVNLVLGGWLTANDLWPPFGTMADVETAGTSISGHGMRPSEPDSDAPLMQSARVHLDINHEGPHMGQPDFVRAPKPPRASVTICMQPVDGDFCCHREGHAGPCQRLCKKQIEGAEPWETCDELFGHQGECKIIPF